MTDIRKLARGQECTLRLPGCNYNPETTVLCHSNRLADGKGIGLKAPDTAAAFGCSGCHAIPDGHAPRPEGMSYDDVQDAFDVAVDMTHLRLREMGVCDA